MRRKLALLDVVLAAAALWVGVRARNEWLAQAARQAAVLNRPVVPGAAPAYQPLARPPVALPSTYVEIAQKMLLDKSRDSTVVVEAAPAPPPKPMPALPVYHGQMDLGDGPTVFLSETAAAPHHGMKVGETIGEFKLVDASSRQLAFEWEGQVVRQNVEDLLDRTGASAPAAPARVPPAAPASAAAAPQPPQHIDPSSSCNPNDGYGAGAVVDGYRKVVNQTPFGPICYWEAARQ